MVRYANRSRTGASVPKGSTPCVTHHFPAGSLHAPYDLLSLLAVGKVTIKASDRQAVVLWLRGDCGLSVEAVAPLLKISPRSVEA